jgi:hypothetical protein
MSECTECIEGEPMCSECFAVKAAFYYCEAITASRDEDAGEKYRHAADEARKREKGE